jgi:hypothetical protein
VTTEPTPEEAAETRLVNRLAFSLTTTSQAKLRAGDRRTIAKAKKMLEAAAADAGVEVKISKNGNGYVATVK